MQVQALEGELEGRRGDAGGLGAVEVEAGALGTCGGPKTDADARVVDLRGNPIDGLYAASNAMAGVTAGAYGGGGGTLGPGMTFGYIAGRHAAQKG